MLSRALSTFCDAAFLSGFLYTDVSLNSQNYEMRFLWLNTRRSQASLMQYPLQYIYVKLPNVVLTDEDPVPASMSVTIDRLLETSRLLRIVRVRAHDYRSL